MEDHPTSPAKTQGPATKYYKDPNTGQRVPIKKTHRFRNFAVLPIAGLFAIGIVISAATGGGGQPAAPPAPPVAAKGPVQAPPPADPASRVELFGDGEATVTITTDGMSSNEVTLPATKPLPPGYASVSVTHSPSIDSYRNGGTGDSGEVGCRIIRDGT